MAADHVHVFAGIKATHCIADLIREVKKSSSNWDSQRFEKFSWQDGYGAFSVGSKDDASVVAYIGRQEEHHRNVSSADELRAILIEQGVDFDERYFV